MIDIKVVNVVTNNKLILEPWTWFVQTTKQYLVLTDFVIRDKL